MHAPRFPAALKERWYLLLIETNPKKPDRLCFARRLQNVGDYEASTRAPALRLYLLAC